MPDQATLFMRFVPGSDAGALSCYTDTHESGIEGVGSLPRHWRLTPLKYVSSLNPDELAETTDPDYVIRYADIGNVTMLGGIESTEEYRFEDAPSRARRRVRDGDTIISTVRTYLRAVARISDPQPNLIVSTGFAVLRPGPDLDQGFLYRLMQAEEFVGRVVARSTGVSYPAIAPSVLARLDIWLPPLPEQEAIAAWLDERTRRIDELVAAKRRLIDLLAEQRTALITHAVTKGLDSAPTVLTGLTAFGEMPAHWRVRPLKFWSNLRAKSFIDGDWIEAPYVSDSGLRLIQCGNIGTGTYEEQGFRFVSEDTFVQLGCTAVHPGDVLICRMRSSPRILAGRACLAPNLGDRMVTAVDNCIVKCAADVDARFLVYLLTSKAHLEHIEAVARGGTRDRVSRSMLGAVRLPCPPLGEQTRIADHLDSACAKLDGLTTAAEAAIARLTEYRQALISAAVTGKINVCGAANTVQPEAASSCEPVIAGRINGEIGGTGRTANKHFQRSVLAAEIIARIGQDRTFGRVKLQKALILAECHLQLDEIESQPIRAAAGPFDNAMMRSIQSQLQKSQWYEYRKDGDPLKFVPLAKAGGHKQYFDRYWGAKEAAFAALMDLLAKLDTQRSEIVATLYSAWNDFLIDQKPVTDDALVAEVLTNWDPAKTAIPEDKWRKAIGWMRGKGLVPTGYGAHTRIAQHDRSKE